MNKLLLALLVSIAALGLSACGGGGGSGSSSTQSAAPTTQSSSGTTETYVSSGSIGEILNFTIDTTVSPPTYNYTIIKSSYNLNDVSSSGVLTSNSDGSYSPSESPSSKVYALPNGLLMGGIKLTIGGSPVVVPILGVSSPVTTQELLAGTYNVISTGCISNANGYPTYPNCGTAYGTVKITSSGEYTTCVGRNISTVPSCNSSTGQIRNPSGGLWEWARTGSSNKNYLLAFKAPNGQTVIVIDFNDPGGNGYGHLIASSQPTAPLISGDADGIWFAQGNNNTSGTTTINGTNFASQFTYGSNAGVLALNDPWIGFVKHTSGTEIGYAILAGTGVYVSRSNTARSTYYELGMLKK